MTMRPSALPLAATSKNTRGDMDDEDKQGQPPQPGHEGTDGSNPQNNGNSNSESTHNINGAEVRDGDSGQYYGRSSTSGISDRALARDNPGGTGEGPDDYHHRQYSQNGPPNGEGADRRGNVGFDNELSRLQPMTSMDDLGPVARNGRPMSIDDVVPVRAGSSRGDVANGEAHHLAEDFDEYDHADEDDGGDDDDDDEDDDGPTVAGRKRKKTRRDQEDDRRVRGLGDVLLMMEDFAPLIPDTVTDYYLARSGFQSDDIRVKRLLALAAQKFVADISSDALHYCKIRQQAHQSKDKKSSAKKNVLTIDDLSAALAEYGVNVKKPEYCV